MVILPYGFEGDGMLWQALCGFEFRMAGGYTGFAPPIPAEYERWPIVDALYDVAPIPDAGGQFKAFLKSHDVGAVIFAGEGDHSIEVSHAGGPGIWRRGPIVPRDREVWNVILGGLGVAAQNVGGVTLYQLPAQLRAQWPNEDPVALQARAAAVRFDTLLAAAYGFVTSGRSLSELSPLAVQQAGLLPPNWVGGPLLRSSPTPGLMLDGLMVAPSRPHRVALGVRGSYAALKPIIDKYRPYAAAIYFPYPRTLSATPPPRRRAGIDDDGIRRRPACARGPRGPVARAPTWRAGAQRVGDSRTAETLGPPRRARRNRNAALSACELRPAATARRVAGRNP